MSRKPKEKQWVDEKCKLLARALLLKFLIRKLFPDLYELLDVVLNNTIQKLFMRFITLTCKIFSNKLFGIAGRCHQFFAYMQYVAADEFRNR